MSVSRIVLIGAGGIAREIRWLAESVRGQSGEATFRFEGYVVTDLTSVGPNDSKADILGDHDWLMGHRDRFDAIAIAIGSPASRLRVAAALEPTFGPEWWPPLIHPSVKMDFTSCRIAYGVQLCAGVVATVNAVIEPHVLLNLNVTVGHETTVGRGSVINPGVNLSGGVTLGAGVLVGTGAQILQYVDVGDGATVGAGAVVVRSVGAGDTVVGVPARSIASRHSGA